MNSLFGFDEQPALKRLKTEVAAVEVQVATQSTQGTSQATDITTLQTSDAAQSASITQLDQYRQAQYNLIVSNSQQIQTDNALITGLRTDVTALQNTGSSGGHHLKVRATPSPYTGAGFVNLTIVEFDTASGYNTTNSANTFYTVPETGFYTFSASMQTDNTFATAGQYAELYLSINGSTLVAENLIAGHRVEVNASQYRYIDGSTVQQLTQGDIIKLYLNSGSAFTPLNVVFHASFLGLNVNISGATIDDNATATTSVWSSSKISTELALKPVINDNDTTSTSGVTYSANKINTLYVGANTLAGIANASAGTNATSINSTSTYLSTVLSPQINQNTANLGILLKAQTSTYKFLANSNTEASGAGFFADDFVNIAWDGYDEIHIKQPTARSAVYAHVINKVNGTHPSNSSMLLTTNYNDYWARVGYGQVEFVIASDGDIDHPMYRVFFLRTGSSGLNSCFAQVTKYTA